MLDDNLPTFFLKPSTTGVKHHSEFFLSHHGCEPAPAYHLQHADPQSPSPTHKNCYAAALFDAYNPDVLFAEVLARPGWTQPTLSQEEIRKQNGIPPPPQPIMPSEFTIQLYNPDQQIRVETKSSWVGSDSYEFSLPENVFRTPSASSLDRGQSDPASLEITPRINFVWRKESKLNRDLTCFMTGKSTDKKKKSSRKDPDITVGLWRNMRELTVYEPNLARVELEDPKGLEVVMLLSAIVIKDLYFSTKDQMREVFNISDATAPRKLSSGGRKLSNPNRANTYAIAGAPAPLSTHPVGGPQQSIRSLNDVKRSSLPKLQTTPPAAGSSSRPPPMADPRAQWELDAETARLKQQEEAESRARAQKRKEKDQADEVERKRLLKMVENEEREARRKQFEIDKETERLRKKYGVTAMPSYQQPPQQPNTRQQRQHLQPIPQGSRPPTRPAMGSNGLYVQPSASSSAVMMSGAGNGSSLNVPGRPPAKKKSFFGLRSVSDDGAGPEGQRKLGKKASAMW